MTVIHILMAPQYLNNSHVLRNNVNRHSIGSTNKLPGAGVQTSYVHFSITNLQSIITFFHFQFLQK